MLNPELKLNEKLFDADVEQLPIRKGFGQGLLEVGTTNEKVVALCADLTESTQMHLFAEKFPDRFIEIGIGEQNLASVASGMSAMGKIPFFSSYAMFSPGRNWEQIRTTLCYNDRKAIIVGSHAGISVGPDGGTHQAIEDIAITRVLPNMEVLVPVDSIQAKKFTVASVTTKPVTYLRLAREKSPVITTEETPIEIGKAYRYWLPSGTANVGIIVTGALVHQALVSAKQLEGEGINTIVLVMPTIKPFDGQAVLDLAKEVKSIVTVEEHQIAGGLGSTVAEFLAQNHPMPMKFIGVHDEFGQSGTPAELLEHYGMSVTEIVKKVKELNS